MVKENLLKRQKTIELEMTRLHAQVRLIDKRIANLEAVYKANEQILKDFEVEDAIEKAKQDQKPSPEAK